MTNRGTRNKRESAQVQQCTPDQQAYTAARPLVRMFATLLPGKLMGQCGPLMVRSGTQPGPLTRHPEPGMAFRALYIQNRVLSQGILCPQRWNRNGIRVQGIELHRSG